MQQIIITKTKTSKGSYWINKGGRSQRLIISTYLSTVHKSSLLNQQEQMCSLEQVVFKFFHSNKVLRNKPLASIQSNLLFSFTFTYIISFNLKTARLVSLPPFYRRKLSYNLLPNTLVVEAGLKSRLIFILLCLYTSSSSIYLLAYSKITQSCQLLQHCAVSLSLLWMAFSATRNLPYLVTYRICILAHWLFQEYQSIFFQCA